MRYDASARRALLRKAVNRFLAKGVDSTKLTVPMEEIINEIVLETHMTLQRDYLDRVHACQYTLSTLDALPVLENQNKLSVAMETLQLQVDSLQHTLQHCIRD